MLRLNWPTELDCDRALSGARCEKAQAQTLNILFVPKALRATFLIHDICRCSYPVFSKGIYPVLCDCCQWIITKKEGLDYLVNNVPLCWLGDRVAVNLSGGHQRGRHRRGAGDFLRANPWG